MFNLHPTIIYMWFNCVALFYFQTSHFGAWKNRHFLNLVAKWKLVQTLWNIIWPHTLRNFGLFISKRLSVMHKDLSRRRFITSLLFLNTNHFTIWKELCDTGYYQYIVIQRWWVRGVDHSEVWVPGFRAPLCNRPAAW